ncbi:protein kinase [Nocardia uniformis]|uniref:Protein kinase n=3 Tax=Nocardia uniformis TaxID=53432 RepID=A0A849C431_9NOCA|nr:protein kinase [Nocardia uniformis]NNH73402.1 protein kinase [Nocardia uniformis]
MNEYPAAAVARFAADWEAALRGGRCDPPRLDHYVPDGREVYLAVLTELVRIDLRQRWQRTGSGKRIAEYSEEFPEIAGSPRFVDLVCEEFLVLRRYRPVDIDTFAAAYPEAAEEIRRRLSGDSTPYSPPQLPEHIETGRRLDDFDLLTDLGGNGRSRVFLARQRSMQRLVAVRVEADTDGDGGTVAQLDHENIVRVFDQRRIEDDGKPLRLLYMQYMPGGTVAGVLAHLRESGGPSGETVPMSNGATIEVEAAVSADPPSSRHVFGRDPLLRGRGFRPKARRNDEVARRYSDADLNNSLVATAASPASTAEPVVGTVASPENAAASRGGRLLLAAVDAAMEARGEIRPADSSVRTEIAELSWPETVAWVGRRLAVALDYAERHGVLHHDIRPDNVLFTAEGVPKLADFSLGPLHSGYGEIGCAAVEDAVSLRYSAPERLARLLDPDAPIPDTRGDIYALGVLLWEMLTGSVPFEEGITTTDAVPSGDAIPPRDIAQAPESGPDIRAALLRRRAGVPDSALAALPADTPATLRRVLLECLHPDPARRWNTGAELAGQLDLCLDARARDLVDPPPTSLRYRARGWLLPIAVLCVGVPNVLASVYNIRLNQRLIVDRLSVVDQQRFELVALVNNSVAFPLAALLLIWLCRRPLAVPFRLARGHRYTAAELARARSDTLTMGDRGVWVPFGMWILAGIAWPVALARSGVDLAPSTFAHFFAAQVVCATIALAYPFFLIMVYAVRSLYPQLLVRGGVGPADGRQLSALARRCNFYLAAAASVPLLGAATATLVPAGDLATVIVPVRWLSVGGILAFVITYWLFRLLESDLRALTRAIPRGVR